MDVPGRQLGVPIRRARPDLDLEVKGPGAGPAEEVARPAPLLDLLPEAVVNRAPDAQEVLPGLLQAPIAQVVRSLVDGVPADHRANGVELLAVLVPLREPGVAVVGSPHEVGASGLVKPERGVLRE